MNTEPLIQFFRAPNATDPDASDLSKGLRQLSELLYRAYKQEGHGGLGGQFGYGADFENEVFMMHHYCWCEKPECLWCTIWLSNEVECTEEAATTHRDKQTKEVREKYGDWPAQHPGAPHFWHKASGLQVRWYKWIGRDMETSTEAYNLPQILAECIESIPADLRAQAEKDHAHENTEAFIKARDEAMLAGMKALTAMLDSQTVCAECTSRGMWGRANDGGMIGGSCHCGIWETLKDANGICHNCGTATTPEQAKSLEVKIQ